MKTRLGSLFGGRMVVAATLAVALTASLAVWAAGKNKTASAQGDTAKEKMTTDEKADSTKADAVHVYLQTVPPRKALVKWGGKMLGSIPAPRPLVIERPHDSGPLDLVIRASGFLPVHTRVYTFSDSRVSVKLTPPSDKSKLFGYKQEPAPNPDGGPPPEPGPAPAQAPATPL
jgi:hypothetical protein